MTELSEQTQTMFDTLKKVARDTLVRKRRLGQYAVVWQDGKPVVMGGDAPAGAAKLIPKGQTLGDLVEPIVDDDDWECLK